MSKRKLTIEEIHKLETALIDVTHKICKEHNIKYSLICGSVLGAVRHGGPIPWDTDADLEVPYDIFDEFCEILIKEMPEWCELDGYKNQPNYHRFFPRICVRNVDSAILHVDIFPQVGIPDTYEEQLKYSKKSDRLKKIYYYKSIAVGTHPYKSRNKLIQFVKRVIRVMMKIVLLPLSLERVYKISEKHFTKYKYKDSKYVMNPAGHYGMKNVLDKKYFEDLIEVNYDGIKVNIPKDYETYLTHYYKDWHTPISVEQQQKDLDVEVWVDEDFDVSAICK